MQNDIEQLIRRTLARRPPPRTPPTLVADIAERARAEEGMRGHRRRWMRRVLLGFYWLVAGVATAWILWSMPLPAWIPSSLTGVAIWLAPLGCGVVLGWAPLAGWLRGWCVRLLQPFPEQRFPV